MVDQRHFPSLAGPPEETLELEPDGVKQDRIMRYSKRYDSDIRHIMSRLKTKGLKQYNKITNIETGT